MKVWRTESFEYNVYKFHKLQMAATKRRLAQSVYGVLYLHFSQGCKLCGKTELHTHMSSYWFVKLIEFIEEMSQIKTVSY